MLFSIILSVQTLNLTHACSRVKNQTLI